MNVIKIETLLKVQQLQDQFDNLEKHTQWGIDFVEKYTKFVKERSEIELNYARQIRNLSKKYQPKKKEDENKYTWCRAFHFTLNELNDYAGQHELVAENMISQIIAELTRYTQELKTERKTHFHDGRKAQQQIEASWKQLELCKRKFERDCKEADRAQQYFEKMDADINVTKADVEKARQQAQMRHQMASDSKSEYSSYLQKFNQEQNDHYYTIIPNIFQKIQVMEEKRIDRMGDSLKTFADVDRQILPIIGKCLDGMTQAADSIESKTDSSQVIESYKSGFEPPGDVEFEDYGQAMKRTVSETSLTSSRPDNKSDRPSKGKSKTLWPFIKKNKGSNPEDFSHLPPEQRRKKLQAKIDDISKDIQKEMDQRDALTKMKEVYVKNPQMGDPTSVDPRLAEIAQNIDKLQVEAQKFEGWLAEVEGRMPVKSDPPRRTSVLYETQNSTPPTNNNCTQDRESPEGSYTDEQSSEVQNKVQTETPEFDEFDDADEEILPTIGTCKAIYPFEGHNEGTIAVTEGELLYVIEEDKGDGWTRVRRNEEEEGYVPTSYVEVFLDSNAKGAITYI
ncbi:formin-binding protein 1-like isoform X14 [Myxocyprinus asiaticus]|uniref:formin-binding protein 1-like isoform X14 n=1 Tax=Myxocyprinus asiaticus TaxID=70543 RepID=UPI00222206ED|nr:formin-binding protein 1-like isoform X14 [Myxocyprinus asiaticus]